MTPNEAAMEEFYDQMREELYLEEEDQIIADFTADRLQSFYLKNPQVMRPAVDAIQEGKKLQAGEHYSAALIFFISAVEILLKTTLLKPVIYGLIHNEALAEVVVKNFLSQSGFVRYENLMSKIFQELSNVNLSSVKRETSNDSLMIECKKTQDMRNRIIHQGLIIGSEDAELSRLVICCSI